MKLDQMRSKARTRGLTHPVFAFQVSESFLVLLKATIKTDASVETPLDDLHVVANLKVAQLKNARSAQTFHFEITWSFVLFL